MSDTSYCSQNDVHLLLFSYTIYSLYVYTYVESWFECLWFNFRWKMVAQSLERILGDRRLVCLLRKLPAEGIDKIIRKMVNPISNYSLQLVICLANLATQSRRKVLLREVREMAWISSRPSNFIMSPSNLMQ